MAPSQSRSASTIYSVADRAGVSIASVSRVLQGSAVVSDSTRRKVLDAVAELNYVPLGAARSLAVRHHEAHGLVLPELTGPYYSELLLGFESRAAELGQSVLVLLAAGKRDLGRAVRQLAAHVDGIAVLGTDTVPREVLRGLQGTKPVVVIAGDPVAGAEAIVAENHDSAMALTTHLLVDHGRRRLLFVGDPDLAADVRDRYRGFVDAHTRMRRRPRAALAVPFREAEGAAVAERLVTGTVRADAMVCANDELALSIMVGLRDGGIRVPRDVAVVGWDDVMTARYIQPSLTTVRHPVHELGALAADRLHQRFTGAPVTDGLHLLPTEVVLRASCGCPEPASTRHTTFSAPKSPTKERTTC